MANIDVFTRETTCEYKGELYLVRDNGAVMRHARQGMAFRKLDNIWTFGTKDSKGYMKINKHRVHIIVAKAFIPCDKKGNVIVDHKDTNRCNNRVENLRWLTRLENVLLNEATLKRVTFLCGGDINNFLEDPSCLKDLTGDNQDVMWMRTVSAEEAKKAWETISAWAKRPSTSLFPSMRREPITDFDEWVHAHEVQQAQSFTLDKLRNTCTKDIKPNLNNNANDESSTESLFNQNLLTEEELESILDMMGEPKRSPSAIFAEELRESMTKGAMQVTFTEMMQFPLCPDNPSGGLDSYAINLKKGEVFACSESGKKYVIDLVGWTFELDALQIIVKEQDSILQTTNTFHIQFENGCYIHSKCELQGILLFWDSPYVLQCGTATKCVFPLCPNDGNITLEEYAAKLQKGVLVECCRYSNVYVFDSEIITTEDGSQCLYVGTTLPGSFKPFGDLCIYIQNGKVIHEIGHTYQDKRYLLREFCKIRKQEWDDDEPIIDDFC